jgi:UDPglucose--hexose-1-phosphate uridylyltransferase
VPQLILLVNAYLDRVRNLSAKSYVKYVSVFRNYGLEAGASLSHPHSQIITTPFVPRTVREEITAAERFWHMHGKCVFCDIMAREIDGPRIVLADRYFTVVAPYASVHPMEFWIIPRRHTANLLGLTEDEKRELAGTLKKSLKALKDTVGDPAYNFGFHFSTSRSDEEYYHWHLEVYPKLSVWAGFEKNTGMYINTVTPETAAAELKKAIELAPQTSV